MRGYRELIERLEKATGPDREIDLALAREFGTLGHASGLSDECLIQPFSVCRRYTASIDAAIALVEKMLPGASVLMGFGQSVATRPWCRIGGVSYDYDPAGPNLPVAICLALLRALEAQQQEPEA